MLKWYLIIAFLLFARGCYFQEGGEVKMEMSFETAYRRSIETLIDWIHTDVNTGKTQVFFRSFSPVHFRFVFSFLFSWYNFLRWYSFYHGHFNLQVTLSRIFQLPDSSWMLIHLYVLFDFSPKFLYRITLSVQFSDYEGKPEFFPR